MKALSLTQPWATLIALGAKRVETRSRATKFRGQVAIHAAIGFPGWAKRQCFMPPFSTVLVAHGFSPDTLPLGRIVCITEVLDCVRTELVREAWCHYSEAVHEERFGDYSDGRFGFTLGEIYRVDPPIYAKGHLGFWNWEPALNFGLPVHPPTSISASLRLSGVLPFEEAE